MTRGEIWWADLGVPFGSEPGFRRPVLVMQIDEINKSRINTVVIIPLTTNLQFAYAPGNTIISRHESKLSKDSCVVGTQITVIDKLRLISFIAKLDEAKMGIVEQGIALILGL